MKGAHKQYFWQWQEYKNFLKLHVFIYLYLALDKENQV